jgi:hypothetical protein
MKSHSIKILSSAIVVTMTTVLVGCSATSQSTMPELSALQAFGGILEASDFFEGGAERAAQEGGPVALAEFAIQNGGNLSAAVIPLKEALIADPTSGGFPEPALIEALAVAADAYGSTLIDLSSRLSACPTGDEVCYEVAYEADNGAGEVARDQFRAAIVAVNTVASQSVQEQ